MMIMLIPDNAYTKQILLIPSRYDDIGYSKQILFTPNGHDIAYTKQT